MLRGDALVFNLPLESAAQLGVLYSNIPLKLPLGNFLPKVLFHSAKFIPRQQPKPQRVPASRQSFPDQR
jgi:hypothetical protein